MEENFLEILQPENFLEIQWGDNELHHYQKRPRDSCSHDDDEDLSSLAIPGWSHGNNQPGISSGVVPSQIGNSYRNSRKRLTDKKYRHKCKQLKEEMQVNMENLKGENESLKKENESLKKDNSLMNQTLRDQEKEIKKLRSDLLQLKHEHEKQNVLVQTLSQLLADPVRIENEKLKDENASLRKNANLNSNLLQLSEENAKLRIENKVLKVQNDALCGKIISDNDKKHGQQQ